MLDTLQEMLNAEAENMGAYIKTRTRQILELQSQAAEVEAGIAAINEVNGEGTHSVWGYISGRTVYVSITGLISFGQVAEYLRAVRAVMDSRVEDRQREELNYSCKVGRLSLSFSVNGSGATCRKVQVGTRTEEVPVYEVVCDDSADAAQVGQDADAV